MSRNATKAPIALPRFAGSTLFKASTPRAGKTSAQPSPVTNAPASATISLSAPHTIIWPIASVTSDQKATRLPPILSGRLPSATPPMQSTVAMKRFEVAAKISITAADALYNWGDVLFDLSLAARQVHDLSQRAIDPRCFRSACCTNAEFYSLRLCQSFQAPKGHLRRFISHAKMDGLPLAQALKHQIDDLKWEGPVETLPISEWVTRGQTQTCPFFNAFMDNNYDEERNEPPVQAFCISLIRYSKT